MANLTIPASQLNLQADNTAPGQYFQAVTPGASDLPSGPCRALYVGTGGDITVVGTRDATPVDFINIPDGSLLPIQVIKVTAVNAADDIVAIY